MTGDQTVGRDFHPIFLPATLLIANLPTQCNSIGQFKMGIFSRTRDIIAANMSDLID